MSHLFGICHKGVWVPTKDYPAPLDFSASTQILFSDSHYYLDSFIIYVWECSFTRGDQNFLHMPTGGPEKIGDLRSQTDGPIHSQVHCNICTAVVLQCIEVLHCNGTADAL